MAKPPVKKKPRTEQISIAKIYETLQSRDFLQELWWDLIADMKAKPTYQRVKRMVNSLVSDTLEDFSNEMPDDAERLKRRTALTEISIMTYTVDTVITEVLFRKLQNEFLQLITNIVDEVKHERRYSKSSSTSSYSMLENIPNRLDNEAEKEMASTSLAPPSTVNSIKDITEQPSSVHTTVLDLNASSVNSETVNRNQNKRGRPRKVTPEHRTPEENTVSSESTPKRKRGRPCKIEKVPKPAVEEETPVNNGVYDVIKHISPIKSDDEESDAESLISVGNLSIDTVSSVHTSELSSFEDTISICSGDEENGKRKSHIPLKMANDMYLSGKLSEIYQMGKDAEKLKMIKSSYSSQNNKEEQSTRNTKEETKKFSYKRETKESPRKEETKESSHVNVTSPRPQRIRKPNSKYISETMFCDVKDYSSSQGYTNQLEEPNTASIKSPQKQKKMKATSSDDEKAEPPFSSPLRQNSASGISPHRSIPNHSTSVPISPKTARKRVIWTASGLYKPRSVVSNAFHSRGTTAVTLFST